MIKDVGEHRARVRSVYQAVEPESATPRRTVSMDSSDPPPLPSVLEQETPTVKLVYIYLEPYSEVEVSVRQLEALLGISHRPAAEAMQRLVALGLLEVLEQQVNRPGRYHVKRNGKETLEEAHR